MQQAKFPQLATSQPAFAQTLNLYFLIWTKVAVVQNMSYMSMPNGEKQYIFGKTDAGFAIAETWIVW